MPVTININNAGAGVGTSATGALTGVAEPRSSPLVVPGHNFERLKQYLDWLEGEGKLLLAAKALANAGLEEYGYGYNDLRPVTEKEWGLMGVKRGAMLVLLNNQKAWAAHLSIEEIIAARTQAEARRMDNSGQD